ncbi:MAG: transposase [Clostridia bacterium]|nr:transposase [Clostridia bacterium]
MELPKRRENRLKHYDYARPGLYFVTVCSRDMKQIFGEIVGDGFPVPKLSAIGQLARQIIDQIPQRFSTVRAEKYVIMPNHLHIILCFDSGHGTGDPSPTLGEVMGWFKYQVTKEVNRARSTPGEKVFQRSFHDHVIRNEEDYLRIWQYIDTNPLKWQEDRYYST